MQFLLLFGITYIFHGKSQRLHLYRDKNVFSLLTCHHVWDHPHSLPWYCSRPDLICTYWSQLTLHLLSGGFIHWCTWISSKTLNLDGKMPSMIWSISNFSFPAVVLSCLLRSFHCRRRAVTSAALTQLLSEELGGSRTGVPNRVYSYPQGVRDWTSRGTKILGSQSSLYISYRAIYISKFFWGY